MNGDSELVALIDLIYEAVLDSDLWPGVLVKLADTTGAAQVSMTSRDQRAGIFTTLSPRTDPDWTATYKDYWRHNQLWQQSKSWRIGEIYSLDSLVKREEFSATPIFNEWWRPSGRGLAAAGANLLDEDQFLVLAYIANAPGKDVLTDPQIRIFKAALRHLIRAVRINHQLWTLELKRLAPPEQFESLPQAALLADASARMVLANAAAKAMLDSRDGLRLVNGHLAAAGGPNVLQRLIATCARGNCAVDGPGGEFKILREPPRSPLHVTVTPLRSTTRLREIPWISVGAPVALITISDPEIDRRRREVNLHRRFGLTAAESRLAAEIVKGDGRVAAARRRGISGATAKTQLARIFEKTGTHRQAELVRLLLHAADVREFDHVPGHAGGE
jgi:DNA-binding CsgD family transcriptional regulator